MDVLIVAYVKEYALLKSKRKLQIRILRAIMAGIRSLKSGKVAHQEPLLLLSPRFVEILAIIFFAEPFMIKIIEYHMFVPAISIKFFL